MRVVNTDTRGLQFRIDYPVTPASSSFTTYSAHLMPCEFYNFPDEHPLADDENGHGWLFVIEMHGQETRREYFEHFADGRRLYQECINSFVSNCSAIVCGFYEGKV